MSRRCMSSAILNSAMAAASADFSSARTRRRDSGCVSASAPRATVATSRSASSSVPAFPLDLPQPAHRNLTLTGLFHFRNRTGHPGTHSSPGRYPHDALIPLQQGVQNESRWTKIRGQSSTTFGGPHFCSTRTPRRNRPHHPALDQRRPAREEPIKGRHPKCRVARRRQLPAGLYFLPA